MTDRTPVIGLTTYSERARWGPWDRRAAVLMNEYSDAVVRAGGVPVLLPPLAAGADAVVARLDGLVLTGGADVDPTRYGAEPLAASDTPRVDRDEWELEVLRAALAAPLPVLAICRGLQVLNVALGGTLHQHVGGHRPQLGQFGTTDVTVESRTRLAEILGPDVKGQCSHHQSVDRLGDGLVVSARAADGTVEGVELPGDQFVVGVQWHPEEDDDPRLFEAFISEV